MHKQQRAFCEYVRDLFPEYFHGTRVVDFGSLDINGTNRELFVNASYTGVDLGEGPNVDVVCRAHEYFPERPVDVVITTETLEHDEFWQETLRHAMLILRPGGLLIITCAKDPRGEHGTTNKCPEDAPFVGDYYRNLSREDLESVLLVHDFLAREFGGNERPGDLYFWGVRR